jgi:hypothetical protein
MKRFSTRIRSLSLPILALLLVLLATCAPAVPVPVETQVTSQVPQAASTEITVSEVNQATPTVVVTPRGPELVATDPSTVSLASGQLQLVEFFRFT